MYWFNFNTVFCIILLVRDEQNKNGVNEIPVYKLFLSVCLFKNQVLAMKS